jgi:hypothetical protein
MFIYSVRASTIKFFGAVALSLAVLITLLALVEPSSIKVSVKGVKSKKLIKRNIEVVRNNV